MAYCPKCHDEFQDGVEICPDCGAQLVSELPVPQPVDRGRGDEPLVHIATAADEVMASLWKEVLEDEGIRSMVKRSDLAAAMYSLPFNTQCEVYVLASDAERAKEILESLEEEGQSSETE
jgi:hypothetical protein